ncbi:MAG: hypothetical protein AVDCRST_MAG12-2826, partial [uncultured Rubrobacteraceae bacterium]
GEGAARDLGGLPAPLRGAPDAGRQAGGRGRPPRQRLPAHGPRDRRAGACSRGRRGERGDLPPQRGRPQVGRRMSPRRDGRPQAEGADRGLRDLRARRRRRPRRPRSHTRRRHRGRRHRGHPGRRGL